MDDPSLVLKQQVGEAAAALVEHGMVVGIGTGSTAACLIDSLGERVKQGLRFVGIPTSKRTEEHARRLGIEIVDLATHPEIDLTLDGADQVERHTLHLVKGQGGALLREKIVAAASRRMVVMADHSKLVERLGEQAPVPVEVSSFGWEVTARRLGELGGHPTPRRDRDGALFLTDGGNLILDCAFGPIEDPPQLETRIKMIVGVFECGLFTSRASLALVAGPDGVMRCEVA